MSWMDEMSEEDREYLISRGYIRADQKDKPIGYQLVWSYCGVDEYIIRKASPYSHCVNRRKEKKKEPQYRNGKFIIKPLFKC